MIVFEDIFKQNNWRPFIYKGKNIFIADTLNVPVGKSNIQIIIEKVSSDYEQGIFLKADGFFNVNNQNYKNSFCIWQSTAPSIINFTIDSLNGEVKIWNIWRINNGPMQYGHNGAALFYKVLKNGRKYFCNYGYPDDDFNDLIFTIKYTNRIIKSSTQKP